MNITNDIKNSSDMAKTEDGRLARGVKSRLKIVEATLSLYEQGIMVPTAQQVADESGMGIRTVFRQFNDMEALFIKGNDLLNERFNNRERVKPEGDLKQRIQLLCKNRYDVFKVNQPYIESTLIQLWRYDVLRNNYEALNKELKKQLKKFIPEIKERSKPIQLAAETAISYESWSHYKNINKLSESDTIKAFECSLHSLLAYQD